MSESRGPPRQPQLSPEVEAVARLEEKLLGEVPGLRVRRAAAR